MTSEELTEVKTRLECLSATYVTLSKLESCFSKYSKHKAVLIIDEAMRDALEGIDICNKLLKNKKHLLRS